MKPYSEPSTKTEAEAIGSDVTEVLVVTHKARAVEKQNFVPNKVKEGTPNLISMLTFTKDSGRISYLDGPGINT